MLERLKEIANGIRALEGKRQSAAEAIRAEKPSDYEGAYEKELVKQIQPTQINSKVCSSDSGLLAGSMHGIDILVCRAVAVMFEYESSCLKSHSYFPSPMPETKIDVKDSLELPDVSFNSSLFRLKSELEVSVSALEKFSPDYLLLDGSIAPLMSDKPRQDSPLFETYTQTALLYKTLYDTCSKKNCTLVGVIKDSRGRRFLEILRKKFSESSLYSSNDSSFLHHLLKEGERTLAFSYSSSPTQHQVLRDLGAWSDKICAFYLKPAQYDRPLRCEFLSGKRSFDEIASFIYSLSKINQKYAYPAILIEADLRAALSPNELERVRKSLEIEAGFAPSTMALRRNIRPFR